MFFEIIRRNSLIEVLRSSCCVFSIDLHKGQSISPLSAIEHNRSIVRR